MKKLTISMANFWHLMAEGKTRHVKIGGRTLFKESDVVDFIDALDASQKH